MLSAIPLLPLPYGSTAPGMSDRVVSEGVAVRASEAELDDVNADGAMGAGPSARGCSRATLLGGKNVCLRSTGALRGRFPIAKVLCRA